MHKKVYFLTAGIALVYFLNASGSLISLFGGISLSGETKINTWYYTNWGIIASANVDINARALSNSGKIKALTVAIACSNSCNVTGSIAASQTCDIKASLLKGNGAISGDKVTILCDEFKFQGSILAKECTIYTNRPFDYSSFSRTPGANYRVILSTQAQNSFSESALQAYAINKFVDNCLKLDQEEPLSEVNEIILLAHLNNINNVPILEKSKSAIEAKIHEIAPHVEEKRGPSADLQIGAACGTLAAVNLCGAAAMIAYRNLLTRSFKLDQAAPFLIGATLAAGSGLCSYLSYRYLSSWLNPQYKERYEKLLAIYAGVKQALLNPTNPDTLIIRLS